MAITIPSIYTTRNAKWAYLMRLDEKLRILHNRVGTWFKEGGITLNQYNNLLPTIVKSKFPYTPQLSATDWAKFVQWHHQRISEISQLISAQKEDARQDATILCDIDKEVTD